MFEWWEKLMKGETSAQTGADEDDPERLLTEAQRQMREAHQRNRERAVQAISAKNSLLNEVDNYRRKVVQLRERADQAESAGRGVEALRLRDEAHAVEVTLRETEHSLQQAVETMEAVKVAIKREEESIHRKTLEALSLKAQWSLVQTEQALANSYRLAEGSTRNQEQFQIHLREAGNARNHLLDTVEQTAQRIAELRVKADTARKRGDDYQERAFLREMEQAEATLERTQEALERANQVIDRLESLLNGEQVEWVYVDPAANVTAWAEADEQRETDKTVALGLALAAVLIVALLLLLLFVSR